MTTAGELWAAAGQLDRQAAGCDAAARRHEAAARALRRATTSVRAGWRSPDADRMVEQLDAAAAVHDGASAPLAAAAGRARSLAAVARDLGGRLGDLERASTAAQHELTRALHAPPGVVEPSSVAALRERVEHLRRRQASVAEQWRSEVSSTAAGMGTSLQEVRSLTARSRPPLVPLSAVGAYLAGRSLVRAGANGTLPSRRGRGINVRNPFLWARNRGAAIAARALSSTSIAVRLGLSDRLRSAATSLGRSAGAHKAWTGRRGFIDTPVTVRGQQLAAARTGLAARAGSVVQGVSRRATLPSAVRSAGRALAPVARRVPVLGTALSGVDIVQGARSGDGLQLSAGVVGVAAGVAVGAAIVVGGPAIVATATVLTVGAAALSLGSTARQWWRGRG